MALARASQRDWPNGASRAPGRGVSSKTMILFPLALLWIVGVIIWVIRNNVSGEPGASEPRDWKRWRPRPPRRPWNAGSAASERRAKSHSPSAKSRERLPK
jgi:hypothetical protein